MKITTVLSSVALLCGMAFTTASAVAAPINFTGSYSENFNAGVPGEWTVSGFTNNQALILGRFGSNTTATLSLMTAGPGTSSLAFRLAGYNSIDGHTNCCDDTFHLSINGTEVYTAKFGMQFASDLVITNVLGATYSTPFAGSRDISIASLALVAGLNTIAFTYGPLQEFADESWSIDDVAMNGRIIAVETPEPGAALLMLSGLALAGLRRRKA